MEDLYTVSAIATGGGRDGHVASSDGQVDLDVRPPQELGGQGNAANPESLFAAAYATCFHGALKLVANSEGIDATGSKVRAVVTLGKDEGGFQLAAKINVVIANLDVATVQKLAEQAHEVCPYSKATRNNIDVEIVAVESFDE
ncbi:organic hydroperoxide resistance protein [Corynebacterium choanae]|uniref:Organic hydroperoxide resistance protein OhrB n=1 Tax=Corynebacterium choanae TaxID=1862358 RepID=A0A3G6J7B1_9CORY|nr:organic hydroperoxide resistance protein [Corynebacterium choanae]AZA14001.1 Organic hydroperoxide resistance protein OhrB [Corynebacterium choanae]